MPSPAILARIIHKLSAAVTLLSALATTRLVVPLNVLHRVQLQRPRSQALPGRRYHRLAKKTCGLSGLAILSFLSWGFLQAAGTFLEFEWK